MKNKADRNGRYERYVPIVCVSEVAAIQDADLISPIGGQYKDGTWWAEPKSLKAFREAQECPCVVTG